MIRKVVKTIGAPADLVQEVFLDLPSWPEWMPGIKTVKVRERRPDHILAELHSVFKGMENHQMMEFSISPQLCKQRQLSGRLKKWEAEWKFFPTPDGSGTTVSVTVDFDLGLIGMFIPSTTISQTIAEWSRDMVQGAETRAYRLLNQRKPVVAVAPQAAPAGEEVLIQVFQTPQGLEIVIGDQKYFVPLAHGAHPRR